MHIAISEAEHEPSCRLLVEEARFGLAAGVAGKV